MAHLQGIPVIPNLNQINPIPRTDTHFFKIYSSITLRSTPRPSYSTFTCYIFESIPTFLLQVGYMFAWNRNGGRQSVPTGTYQLVLPSPEFLHLEHPSSRVSNILNVCVK